MATGGRAVVLVVEVLVAVVPVPYAGTSADAPTEVIAAEVLPPTAVRPCPAIDLRGIRCRGVKRRGRPPPLEDVTIPYTARGNHRPPVDAVTAPIHLPFTQ